FVNGETYVAMATGIVDDMDDPFIILTNPGQERSNLPGEADILLFHGSHNAPEVDITVDASDPLVILFDDVEYQEYQGYLGVPPANYVLDVQTSDNVTTVATYLAPLVTATNGAAVVFASGFLGSDPGFGVFVALPTGLVFPLALTTSSSDVTGVFDDLELFPNPANSTATINYTISESSDLQFRLFAANGQMVKTGSFGTQASGQYTEQLDLNDLAEGFYIFQLITDNGGTAYHKLTIQR
ncbi:MAG: T9SS type A sorting domain-containing protein, partial [Bacteroidota bacterium]